MYMFEHNIIHYILILSNIYIYYYKNISIYISYIIATIFYVVPTKKTKKIDIFIRGESC